jgi:hypothetical protein
VAVAALALLGACGDDDDADEPTTTTPTTAAGDTTTTSTTAGETTTTTTAPEADPVAAAEAWLGTHFAGMQWSLDEFRQGDSQSGELDVLRFREDGSPGTLATTLLLRIEGGEYAVIGAVHPSVTIEAPSNGAEVPAGPLTVSGLGRGFEAAIGVRATTVDGDVVAQAPGMGGSMETPEPYAVQLDLSAVPAGTPLYVIANGGTGLETDTGEFAAVRITIAS